jgi:microcompartment protein CcmL/EutN
MEKALGLIETRGLIGAIEAADAMAKSANVKIISKEKITAGLVTIKIVGDVASVKSAIDAGAAAAQRVGQLISSHVIPHPDDQIEALIYDTLLETPQNIEVPAEDKAEKPKIEETYPIIEVTAAEIMVEKSEIEETAPKIEVPAAETEIKKPKIEESIQLPKVKKQKKTIVEEENSLFSNVAVEKKTKTAIKEDQKFKNEIVSSKLESLRKEALEEINPIDVNKEISPQLDIPSTKELSELNVHKLRHIARSIADFPIKGRQISKATRNELRDYFEKMR